MEQIYILREEGQEAPPEGMKRLELIIEDVATHPAFADCEGFHKGYTRHDKRRRT